MTGIFAPRRRVLSVGVLVSVSVIAFESLAVATILPTAAIELDGLAWYGWAFTAFLLASLVGAVEAGELADRRGSALPAWIGFATFGIGLLIAGLAPAWAALLVGRALQGFGGGMLLALAYAAVARGYPAALQAQMLALLSSAWVIPAFVGPVIAGQLAELVSWRAVFLALLPIVLGAAALFGPASRHLPAGAACHAGSSVPASVRLAVGVGLLLWASGQAAGLPTVAAIVLGGVLVVPALLRLLPRGTLVARPGLPAGTSLRFFLALGFFGGEALIPLGLTALRQAPPSQVGFALSAAALSWVGASWLQARADTRDGGAGRERRVRFGLALLAVGILGACFAVLWSAWPVVVTTVAWAVSGLGIGVAYPASTVLALNAADALRSGEASASLQVAETLGTAVGTGISGALFALGMQLTWSTNTGIVLAFGIAAAAIVVAFIPASRLRAFAHGDHRTTASSIGRSSTLPQRGH
jgi:MFS family permease